MPPPARVRPTDPGRSGSRPDAQAVDLGQPDALGQTPAKVVRLMTIIARSSLLGLLAVVATGCSFMTRSHVPAVVFPTPSLTAGEYALPVLRRPALAAGEYYMCAGVGLLHATLRGDPSDPWVAWLDLGARRANVTWPDGYRARFSPDLEVLDAAGTVVLRDGSSISGACVGPGDLLSLDTPFR